MLLPQLHAKSKQCGFTTSINQEQTKEIQRGFLFNKLESTNNLISSPNCPKNVGISYKKLRCRVTVYSTCALMYQSYHPITVDDKDVVLTNAQTWLIML